MMKRCYLLLILLATLADTAFAGGPTSANGTIGRRYPATAFPLAYRVDQGALGTFSNTIARSITDYAFLQWDNVSSAAISFTNAGSLARDVTLASDAYISGNGQFSDGVNPVVFDTDGSITDAKLGVGAKSSVLGFASSAYTGNNYIEGYMIINGSLSGAGAVGDQDRYRATITHEVGHFLGLGHSQVAMHADFATMYPIVSKTAQQTLEPDDTAAIANLYPAAGYAASVGSISGTVRGANNANLSGVNVVAVNTATGAAYSTLVDYFSGGKSGFDNPPPATGTYTLTGLPPGSYYVRIEPVNANFTGGSSVGSYNTPVNVNISREWYNGGGESGDMLADNTNLQTSVGVSPGTTTTGINLVENTSPTLSSLLYHDGTPSIAFSLPQGNVVGYATRFTAPVTGSLVSIKFRLQGNSNLPLNGTLTVTVHANMPGSLTGIPGAALGSVTVPFRDLVADQNNEVWVRSIGAPINFVAGQEFHVSFTSNNVGTPVFLTDDGNPTQNRSSYQIAGVWRNFGDGGFPTGYNLIVWGLYSSAVIGTPVPKITTSATALDFGTIRPGASVDRTVRVTNPGTATLNVTGTPILGPDSLDYRVIAGGGAFSIPPGGSRDLTLRFAPLRAGGREDPSKSAMLAIMSNADPSPFNIPLVGNAVQPLASRLDSVINFGSRVVGGVYIIDTAIIQNTCTDTLHVREIALFGSDAGAFRILSSGPNAVPPGAFYRVRLQFTPLERRAYNATLRVLHDDSTGQSSFAVTGRGIAPVMTRSTQSLQAGSVRVGTSAAMPPLSISNTGDAPMRVTAIRIIGPDAADFSFAGGAPALPTTLQPGASLPIALRFTPRETGVRTASLEIVADGLPPQQVALSGTGVQAILSLSTSAVDFGDVVVGSSDERTITVTNNGTDTATLRNVAATGAGFSVIGAPAVGTRVAPGGSFTLRVRFTPQSTGPVLGAATVSNDGAEPTLIVALSGRGVQPGLAVSRSTIAYGVVRIGEARVDSFTIRNTGTAPLVINGLTLSGPDADAFELLAPALPFTIPPGGSQSIRVRLEPQSSERVLAATLGVLGSSGTSATLALSATIGQGLVAVSSSVGFGLRPANGSYDTIAMVRNVTGSDITIASITARSAKDGVPGDYFQVFNTAPFVLRAGDSIDLRIRFNPTAGAGSYTGSVTIRTDAPVDSVTIALNGSASAVGLVEREIVAGGVTLALLPVTPNPARDAADVIYSIRGSGRLTAQLLLIDERGAQVRQLYDGVIIGDGVERRVMVPLDLATLPSGMYQVMLRSERGSIATKLVVVR